MALSKSMISALQYVVEHPEKSTPNEVKIAIQKLDFLFRQLDLDTSIVDFETNNSLPDILFENSICPLNKYLANTDEFSNIIDTIFYATTFVCLNPVSIKSFIKNTIVAVYIDGSNLDSFSNFVFVFNTEREISLFERMFIYALDNYSYSSSQRFEYNGYYCYNIWF